MKKRIKHLLLHLIQTSIAATLGPMRIGLLYKIFHFTYTIINHIFITKRNGFSENRLIYSLYIRINDDKLLRKHKQFIYIYNWLRLPAPVKSAV